MLEAFINFITFVGFYALSCYLYDNLRSPFLLLRCKFKELLGEREPSLTERYGKWAAITGATDGIGKAYARELARQGLNVILISRTESKLNSVATDIELEFGVQTKIIVADFTKGLEIYEHIEKELADISVGILINNVGATTSHPGVMRSFSSHELMDVIGTNIVAVTELSRYFLKRMRESGVKGAIVNISSGSEQQPLPFAAVYAASKAFTRSLTISLQEECRHCGITVQLVSPNFVVTKINSYSKLIMSGGLFIPDADTYAKWAVNTLGKVDETTGYSWHGLQTGIFKFIPWRVRVFLFVRLGKKVIDNKNKFK